MSELFKVVTSTGVTAYAGAVKSDVPQGLSQAKADADAKGRNERAEALAITTRYEVVPFDPAA